MELSDLEAMVQEVNATQVAPEEKLSDHVYKYDAKEYREQIFQRPMICQKHPLLIVKQGDYLMNRGSKQKQDLDRLGEEKSILFLIMSDTDSTFNFLIARRKEQ